MSDASPKASLFTIDLAVNESTKLPQHGNDSSCRASTDCASQCRMCDNVTCLTGDSATFDFNSAVSWIDMAFIDGSHSQEYVENDSAIAFALLRKGRIFWHDYHGGWDGVNIALDKLAETVPLFLFENTSLVMFESL